MFAWLENEAEDCRQVSRAIPFLTMAPFVLSVVPTNLMAAKFIVCTDYVHVTGIPDGPPLAPAAVADVPVERLPPPLPPLP